MTNTRSLKVGAFQFAASQDIESNLRALKRGIQSAADQGLRLLLTQECALCGYPPIETPSIHAVDQSLQTEAVKQVSDLARSHKIFIALGMITFSGSKAFNSVKLICPDGGFFQPYHKRALWGWDQENFHPGNEIGVYEIDGLKIGTRICYEVRFPEYFRELFYNQVDLALVSFADIGKVEQSGKFNIIQSHLVSRAAENGIFVLSANSTSLHQLAPTCLVDPDGNMVDSAPTGLEYLLAAQIEFTQPGFGRQGRISHSRLLSGRMTYSSADDC